MKELGLKAESATIADLGINPSTAHWNTNPKELAKLTVDSKQGIFTDKGALNVNTGEFTGRSPKDRFIVEDNITRESVWWGDINIKFDSAKFDALYNKVTAYLEDKEVYVRDSYVCANPKYKLNIRSVFEEPFLSIFAFNMFLRPSESEIKNFTPGWSIVCAPGFQANPEVDGTRQGNFAILNFTRKLILIGGTGYTGEIKKGVFSILNYILPHDKGVLSMHCSSNIGKDNDTSVFFGLSGTGKTTLSSDPNRRLIGDDEHGWSKDGIFNFEGGCYAKCIDLSSEKEPQIYGAIKEGALLENITFKNGNKPDYMDGSITENTRVSYPIYHIDNIIEPSIGTIPNNIFFLTADAFGVLPPISKLSKGQAMYHFISGYTAKVAGTEEGITEPQTTFSACFGAPFFPLHPTKYAEMLGGKMDNNDVNIWLINTGWSGGAYGTGDRIKLKYTRAMITAALEGKLADVDFINHEVFGLAMPTQCEGVPTEILSPKNTWEDKMAYDTKANELAEAFVKNFCKYSNYANDEIMAGAPKVVTNA